MTTPGLGDTDEAVVRWHECTRRQAYATDIQAILSIQVEGHVSYICPWSPDHFHVGRIPAPARLGQPYSAGPLPPRQAPRRYERTEPMLTQEAKAKRVATAQARLERLTAARGWLVSKVERIDKEIRLADLDLRHRKAAPTVEDAEPDTIDGQPDQGTPPLPVTDRGGYMPAPVMDAGTGG